MKKNFQLFFQLILFFFCSSSITVTAGERSGRFQLPNHGYIQFLVPSTWQGSLQQPPNQLPPTIKFKQRAGSPFEVLITPIWSFEKDGSLSNTEAVRSQVEQAAEKLKSQALEQEILIKELVGLSGSGYCFSVTDRAPAPGEYKYMTQGIIRVGNLNVTFTILTNYGQKKVVSDALTMLKSAVHLQGNPRKAHW